MRGQYIFCIAKGFCMFYFTVINSEDLASILLEILVIINLSGTLTQTIIMARRGLERCP